MDVKEAVRARYGSRAVGMLDESQVDARCCESSCCGDAPSAAGTNPFSEGLYAVDELEGIPLRAALGTLGCGNPLAVAELHESEVVLDLGSGGGLDVILSARRVGPSGHAYGLDMTDEMLALAWKNAAEAGVGNVTFMKGDIEAIPMPQKSVDVIISNCVINLAARKDRVMREMFRVLKSGGRLAVTDVVIEGGLPDHPISDLLRKDIVAWGSCLAGALTDGAYRTMLEHAGFVDIELEVGRRHTTEELFPRGLPEWAKDVERGLVDAIMGRFTSTFVRATKPRS